MTDCDDLSPLQPVEHQSDNEERRIHDCHQLHVNTGGRALEHLAPHHHEGEHITSDPQQEEWGRYVHPDDIVEHEDRLAIRWAARFIHPSAEISPVTIGSHW